MPCAQTRSEADMLLADGYGTLFPYMIVSGAPAFIDFLVSAFDAVEIDRTVG